MTRTVANAIERLDSFKQYGDGWYEAYSKAPNHELIDFVSEIIRVRLTDEAIEPWAIGASGDGGLVFESGGLGELNVWDIDLHYDTRPRVDQWVLSVVELEDYTKDDGDYNELEFRSRTLWRDSFTEFFVRALEKRIFTWE